MRLGPTRQGAPTGPWPAGLLLLGWGGHVVGRKGPLRRDPLAGLVPRLGWGQAPIGLGSGSQGEQGVLGGRLPPLGPPMGALVPLHPGGRNHGAPDAANTFAALVGGEIGAGGALAEQADHQSLRESEEPRFAWPAAWAASVKLHRGAPSGGARHAGAFAAGGLVGGGWLDQSLRDWFAGGFWQGFAAIV